MPGGDGGNAQYQGLAELDQQFGDTGYSVPVSSQIPPQQQQHQNQGAPDIVIAPSQQQPVAVSENISDSLMDHVGQHDVFSPGQ